MGKTVGKLIKNARTEADMTQEQLARRVTGLDARDISLAERGEKDLTQAQLKKIAAATGVTQASLLNAAKAEKGTSSATKKATAEKAAPKKPKTPSNANSTMKVTATERKLIDAYRLADSDTCKRAMALLKGESADLGTLLSDSTISDKVSDVLEDVISGLIGGK